MSFKEIINNFSLFPTEREDLRECLPSWMSSLMLLGGNLMPLTRFSNKYLFGLSLPVINFCPLLIAAGANLYNLRNNLQETDTLTLRPDTIKTISESGKEEFTVKDNRNQWVEGMRYQRNLSIDGIENLDFYKTSKNKQIYVPVSEFFQRVKSGSYSAEILQIPNVIRAIFPKLDINWFIHSGEISSSAIVDVKKKVFDDASNKIYFRGTHRRWTRGMLSDICKISEKANENVGSFTNIYTSQRALKKPIEKDLVIYTHSAFNKLNAISRNDQKEKIRLIIFDRSKDSDSLNLAKENFYGQVSSLAMKRHNISSLRDDFSSEAMSLTAYIDEQL